MIPSQAFLWMKALHLISVICWFAALFYLPRLYVYHAMSDDAISHARFQVMERKLYRGIMWPAMLGTLITAHFLVDWGDVWYGYHQQVWFYLKISLVALLVVYHFSCGYYRKKLIENAHYKRHRFWRFFNEIPTIILLAVVLLVVLKPQF